MESDGVITHQQAEQARNAPLGLHIAQPEGSVAPWFQEEVRRELEKRFGAEQVHEAGLQRGNHARSRPAADRQSRRGRRAGRLRAPPRLEAAKLENVLAGGESLDDYRHPDWAVKSSARRLRSRPGHHACCRWRFDARVGPPADEPRFVLLPEDWQWTGQRYGDALVKPGDIIYVHLADAMEGGARRATLEQDSGAQGALMAIDNTSGDVLAMVGGRDYALSEFNRATQAERQTGSSFKPYVYTAAIEDGAKPTDIIVDGAGQLRRLHPAQLRERLQGRDDPHQRLCRVAQHSRAQAGRARGHSQGHRHGPPLRRHLQHSRLSAHRHRRGRNHARGAGGLLLPSFPTTAFASRRA